MKTPEIRQKFLDYFAKNGHTVEVSSPLVPHNDKTLLFVNAGMVPFKDVFSGAATRPYTRAVSCQRCVRAGGKHNDLENVGYTARHHTFFEMLGNFSFGDYFKSEAIKYAWDFLTIELKIPAERLWVSVFEEDDEAERIWVEEIGFPKNRISRCGMKDNFWQMGDTGPCGPCSEIFYDHGADVAGGPPGHADQDGDRYIEIWNLVFTQFDRQEDGYLKPLAAPGVDTGMGLERLAAVLQHKNNNYDTDAFDCLTSAIVKMCEKPHNIKQNNTSVRVISDHIRAATFIIVDGVIPDNEGRGYVLRRIIRRAIQHGHKLGFDEVFFYKLAPVLALQMKAAYPELQHNLAHIEATLKQEEQRFITTLDQGLRILEDAIDNLYGTIIDGETVFKLYDTYGFPADLTADIAREKGLTIDQTGFEVLMTAQKNRARGAGDFAAMSQNIAVGEATQFLGYDDLENTSTVQVLVKSGEEIDAIKSGDEAIVVLEDSVFYGESGGQVGDSGILSNSKVDFKVADTQKTDSGAILHYGKLAKGSLKVGDILTAKVDKKRRKDIMRNHSATHLLHAALRAIFGETITQKGSLVDADKLRFDFSFDRQVAQKDLDKIEQMVNQKILKNTKTHTDITDIKTAKSKGAIALFGEKYGDKVRVLTMGSLDFSVELCGGTHVRRLGDIGLFKIIAESGVGAGVRRIEATTAINAYQFSKNNQDDLATIAEIIKSDKSEVVQKVRQFISGQKVLEKQLAALQKQLSGHQSIKLADQAIDINGIKLLATELKSTQPKDLRDIVDKLKVKLKSAIIVLAAVDGDKIALVAGVTPDLVAKYPANQILPPIAKKVGGKAGGRPDLAQGGGTIPAKLKQALASIKNTLV